MAFSKVIIFATAIILISATPILRNSDIYICNEEEAATSVFDQTVQRDPQLTGVEMTIHIPESGFLDTPLTCIVVTDLDTDQAEASIESGGIGTNSVVIKLKSKWLKGLHYRVQAWTE